MFDLTFQSYGLYRDYAIPLSPNHAPRSFTILSTFATEAFGTTQVYTILRDFHAMEELHAGYRKRQGIVKTANKTIIDHFVDANKMVPVPKGDSDSKIFGSNR